MTDEDADFWKQLLEGVSRLEKAWGLDDGTLLSFADDVDDWTFILRSAAIVETILKSAVFDRLTASMRASPMAFGAPPASLLTAMNAREIDTIERVVFRANIRGSSGSVEKMATSLGLIDTQDIKFISALIEIRNLYAHSIRYQRRSIASILSEKTEEQFKSRKKDLSYGIKVQFGDYQAGRSEIGEGLIVFLLKMAKRTQPSETVAEGILSLLFQAGEEAEA